MRRVTLARDGKHWKRRECVGEHQKKWGQSRLSPLFRPLFSENHEAWGNRFCGGAHGKQTWASPGSHNERKQMGQSRLSRISTRIALRLPIAGENKWVSPVCPEFPSSQRCSAAFVRAMDGPFIVRTLTIVS